MIIPAAPVMPGMASAIAERYSDFAPIAEIAANWAGSTSTSFAGEFRSTGESQSGSHKSVSSRADSMPDTALTTFPPKASV